jgi:hypothetical protein
MCHAEWMVDGVPLLAALFKELSALSRLDGIKLPM